MGNCAAVVVPWFQSPGTFSQISIARKRLYISTRSLASIMVLILIPEPPLWGTCQAWDSSNLSPAPSDILASNGYFPHWCLTPARSLSPKPFWLQASSELLLPQSEKLGVLGRAPSFCRWPLGEPQCHTSCGRNLRQEEPPGRVGGIHCKFHQLGSNISLHTMFQEHEMPLPYGKSVSLTCAHPGFCMVSKKHYKIKREAREIL